MTTFEVEHVFTVIFDGHVIAGKVWSTTVTVCKQVLVFPATSVAVHITVLTPLINCEGLSFEINTVPEQSSVAVAVPIFTCELVHEFTVIDDGHVIAGNVWSTTVTVCKQVLVLPATSVAVHVTVLTPLLNCDGLSFVINTVPKQSSVAVAVPIFTCEPVHVFTVIAIGHVIAGNVWSTIVTVCKHVLVLPATSVAVHVIVFEPLLKL